MSHVTCYFFLPIGGATQWGVCYRWGLSRLVLNISVVMFLSLQGWYKKKKNYIAQFFSDFALQEIATQLKIVVSILTQTFFLQFFYF